MERIQLALGRVFYENELGLRIDDRPPRWLGLGVGLFTMVGGYYCFLHGVFIKAWYALPGILVGVLSFFVLARLIAGALMQQTLNCSRSEVVLHRFRFRHEVAPKRISVPQLREVGRGEIDSTKYGPVHGLVFTGRSGETLQTLRSMPPGEMQALLLRLNEMRYPVVLDSNTPQDVRLGDPPARGLWRWL